jgi:hypothetical protein
MFAVGAGFFLVGQQHGAPAQPGFDGAQRGDGFPCFGARSGGELGIGAVSGETALADGGFGRDF